MINNNTYPQNRTTLPSSDEKHVESNPAEATLIYQVPDYSTTLRSPYLLIYLLLFFILDMKKKTRTVLLLKFKSETKKKIRKP